MRRYGAFLIETDVQRACRRSRSRADGAVDRSDDGRRERGRQAGRRRRSTARWSRASRRRRAGSRSTRARWCDWGWPEQALPGYIRSHVHRGSSTARSGEMVLLPTFRLPTLIHTRSGNAKYLNEISHRNPLWVHTERRRAPRPRDGRPRPRHHRDRLLREPRLGDGGASRPGVVACSHHLGRWRLHDGEGSRWSTAARRASTRRATGGTLLRQVEGVGPVRERRPRLAAASGGATAACTRT